MNGELFREWRRMFEDQRVKRVWLLGLLALLLHGVADPLLSYIAIKELNIATEANPLMAGYIQQGLLEFFAIHIPLYLITFLAFFGVTLLFARASEPEFDRLYKFSVGTLLLIIVWGVLLVGNILRILLVVI